MKIKTIIVPVLVILAFMFASYFAINGIWSYLETKIDQEEQEEGLGSVARGGEYQATSTTAMDGGGQFVGQKHVVLATTTPFDMVKHVGVPTTTRQRFTPVVLGSITITSSTPFSLTLRNATSTTDKASTTMMVLDNNITNNITPGTYVFDMIFDRGIALDFESGFNGSYIITYR